MIDSSRVLAIGFKKEELETLAAGAWPQEYALFAAATYRQIMEENYFAVLIAPALLAQKELAELTHFFTKIDGQSTVKLIVAEDPEMWKLVTNAEVFTSFTALHTALPTLLPKAYTRAKRAENLAKNLSASFYVLRLIQDNPKITSPQIATRIQRSEPAARRFIEELRLAGLPIVYDNAADGWVWKG